MGKTVALGRSVPLTHDTPFPFVSYVDLQLEKPPSSSRMGSFPARANLPGASPEFFGLKRPSWFLVCFGCWSAAKGGGPCFLEQYIYWFKKTHIPKESHVISGLLYVFVYMYICISYFYIYYTCMLYKIFIYTCMCIFTYIYICICICVYVIAKASCLASTRYLNGQERSQRSHAWLAHNVHTLGCPRNLVNIITPIWVGCKSPK